MDDLFLLTHTFSLLADKPNIDHHVSKPVHLFFSSAVLVAEVAVAVGSESVHSPEFRTPPLGNSPWLPHLKESTCK